MSENTSLNTSSTSSATSTAPPWLPLLNQLNEEVQGMRESIKGSTYSPPPKPSNGQASSSATSSPLPWPTLLNNLSEEVQELKEDVKALKYLFLSLPENFPKPPTTRQPGSHSGESSTRLNRGPMAPPPGFQAPTAPPPNQPLREMRDVPQGIITEVRCYDVRQQLDLPMDESMDDLLQRVRDFRLWLGLPMDPEGRPTVEQAQNVDDEESDPMMEEPEGEEAENEDEETESEEEEETKTFETQDHSSDSDYFP